MFIALDAMGGDYAPHEVILGALEAVRALGVDIALVGQPDRIGAELSRVGGPATGLSIIPADEVISMDESALAAVRRKRNSSIVVGLELVKSGRAAAFVSAGSTGAVMAGATLHLGRLTGIDRPALGAVFPAREGRRVLLLDAGANADCRPVHLVQFAEMGTGYAERVLGIPRPRVGLISIGEEASKGSQLTIEAHKRLRATRSVNFVGNIEGRDIATGKVDVAVTDGFTGNVVLKTAEGAADYIVQELRQALGARLHYRLAALALRPALLRLRSRIDYAEYGGAPLLGIRGVVIVAHGRSKAQAVTAAIRAARASVESGLLTAVGERTAAQPEVSLPAPDSSGE